MLTKDKEMVIASVENNDFSIYTFVVENDNVEELIEKANTQFKNFPQYNKKYEYMSYEEFQLKQKNYYMESCQAVTEKQYWEMYEVLPPIYIDNFGISGYDVLNAFMVSEPLTFHYYDGYIKYRNNKGEIKYATKVIWRGDRSTYWTKEDLDNLEMKGEN